MATIPVYNLQKENVGELSLSDDVFSTKVNEDLLYDVLKAQLASKRAGTACVKNRAAVAGSSKKIVKQKGTGGARHGSKRAPQLYKGGQVHGPVPRSYAYRPTRKMRNGALCSALSLRMKEGRIVVLHDFELSEIKTKTLASVLGQLGVAPSSLIVDHKDNDKLRMSARNLERHLVLPPEGVNLYDVLRHEHLVLTRKAVEALEARCKSGCRDPRQDQGVEIGSES